MFKRIAITALLVSLFSFPNHAEALSSRVCNDLDLDGYGLVASKACSKTGIDCNDSNASINPGAKEVCDSIDNNCNGQIDEGGVCCSPTTGQPCSAGIGECSKTGTIQCNGSCNAIPGSPVPEICDGKDNNCNGSIDEGNACCSPSMGLPCSAGVGECFSNGTIQCDGTCNAVPKSPVPEVCGDGKDNDCDSVVDNGCLPQPDLKVLSVFKGSYDRTTQTNFVATKNNLAILVESGASRTVDLKNANPNLIILRYTKFAGTHSPVTRPPNGDFFYSLAVGPPNLIWYGPSGNPMKQSQFGWYFIDIIHNDMSLWAVKQRDFQISDSGKYDGEFLDSAGPQTPDLISEYPSNYSSVPSSDPSFNNDYANAAVNLMAKIRLANPDSVLIVNGYAGWMPQGYRGMGFLPNSNGIMFEGYAKKVGGKFWTLDRYSQQIDDFCTATKDGQKSIAVDYLTSDIDSSRMFVFASYLLSSGQNSYIYTISPKGDVSYFPEHSIELGKGVPPCSTQSSGLFSRRFNNGILVYVNMSGVDKTIDTNKDVNQKLVITGDTLWNGTGSISWVATDRVFVLKTGEAIIIR